MSAINSAGLINRPYPVKDTLLFKIQGAPEAIELTAAVVKKIVEKHGSERFEFAATDEEAEDLWQNRKYSLMSSLAMVPGARGWATDVWCAPLYRIIAIGYGLMVALLAFQHLDWHS
jgi:D-lactate dehydrogenase (cytochrome)